jgi:hypothetical protein
MFGILDTIGTFMRAAAALGFAAFGGGARPFSISACDPADHESTALVGLGLAGVAVLAGFSVSDLDAPRRQTSPRCAGARGF